MNQDKTPTYVLKQYVSDGSITHANVLGSAVPRIYINLDTETAFRYSTGRKKNDSRIREHMMLHKTSLMLHQMLDKWILVEVYDYRTHVNFSYEPVE